MKALICILMSVFMVFNAEAMASAINISAAASLKDALDEIKLHYEVQSDNKLNINYGGSGILAMQIINGASIDLFLSADEKSVDNVAQYNLISKKQELLKNDLVIVAYKGFKATSLDLDATIADNVKKIAIGNVKTVPAGRYTHEALVEHDLYNTLRPKFIYTQNVRQALNYVLRHEVELAFVYLSDYLMYKDELDLICKVPLETTIAYYMGVIKHKSIDNYAVNDFVTYLTNQQSREIFLKYGFRLTQK